MSEGYATPETAVKHARKQYVCDWCGQPINIGDAYSRWRWFGDIVCTVRAHEECIDAVHASDYYREEMEFNRKQSRGCDCGSDPCDDCVIKNRVG